MSDYYRLRVCYTTARVFGDDCSLYAVVDCRWPLEAGRAAEADHVGAKASSLSHSHSLPPHSAHKVQPAGLRNTSTFGKPPSPCFVSAVACAWRKQ